MAMCQTPRSVKVIQVVETLCARGAGTDESPVRTVVQYWSMEGKLLAENDPEANRFYKLPDISDSQPSQ